MKVLELLAPAGSRAAFMAAINAGADALYFGLGAYNARGEAANLTWNDFNELMKVAALYDVKTYLTLNTLLSEDELQAALDMACKAYAAGVDAIILQDKGLALALQRYLPDLALHGSTQMSITCPEALYEAKTLGLSRVILPRELSYEELKWMHTEAQTLGLETEIFVHGALCVCVSGQCALSFFNGGRSANRGACAQACRLDYELEMGGRAVKRGPLLSPKDQALIDDLQKIQALGIDSIKIEGRRRSATYVGASTAAYRQVLDAAKANAATTQKNLLLAFNRGGSFTRNWFGDERNPDFLSGAWPGSYGIKIATVVEAQDKSGKLMVRSDNIENIKEGLVPGSVVALRDDYQNTELASAPIGKINTSGGLLEIKAFHPQVLRKIHRGCSVYLMQSQTLTRSVEQGKSQKKNIISFQVLNEQQCSYLLGQSQDFCAKVKLEQNEAYPALDEGKITKALSKLGQTAFRLGEIKIAAALQLPLAVLNQARRSVCESLETAIIDARKRRDQTVRIKLDDFSFLSAAISAAAQKRRELFNEADKVLYLQNYKGELKQITEREQDFDRIVVPIAYLGEDQALCEHILNDSHKRYALALPLLICIEDHKKWRALLEKLCAKAPRLLYCPTAAGQGWCDGISNLTWTQDSGSHIMNSLSALWSLAQGSIFVSPADELSPDSIAHLIKRLEAAFKSWNLDLNSLNMELQVSGLRRAMYCRHCNLGFRKKACHACRGTAAVLIQSSNGLELRQIFHPEADCCMELLIDQTARNEALYHLSQSRDWSSALHLRYNYCL